MQHHAYVIEGDNDAGVEIALAHARREFGLEAKNNPDVIILRYGLLSIEDVRKILSLAHQAPLRGEHKAIVVSGSRIYHEAQNALLKLFEEPPKGTVMYLIVSSLGQLLPTLRSRVVILKGAMEK